MPPKKHQASAPAAVPTSPNARDAPEVAEGMQVEAECAVELRVLCFNLWGIFNSKRRVQRMRHFASKIPNYDLILLQEQFDPADFLMMKEELCRITGFPLDEASSTCGNGGKCAGYYFQRFRSGFYGCGVAVISKYPIVSALFHCYPLQGYPERILHGDFFANKGAALVKVAVPLPDGATQVVHAYSTHLVATYEKISRMRSPQAELYMPFRVSQALSFAQFIANTSTPADHIIVGGDFNASQFTLEVRLFLVALKLHGFNLQSVLKAVRPCTAEDEGLHTVSHYNAFNCSKTSYFKLFNLESDSPNQIDHIFYNSAKLSVVGFEDCPDKRPRAPALTRHGEGQAGGRSSASMNSSFADYLAVEGPSSTEGARLAAAHADARTAGGSPPCGIVVLTNNSEVPCVESGGVTWCPLSDHYGVAAKLRFLASVKGGCADAGTQSIQLTSEEKATLSEAIAFMELSVAMLRRGTQHCLLTAGVSITLLLAVIAGVGAMSYTQCYPKSSKGTMDSIRSATASVWSGALGLYGWASNVATNAVTQVVQQTPAPAVQATTAAVGSGGSGNARSSGASFTGGRLLSGRRGGAMSPFAFVAVNTAANVTCTITAVATVVSLLLGVIHRGGNAGLLEEQLNSLRRTAQEASK